MRNMINDNRDGYEIDLQKLLFAYLSHWRLIAGMAVLTAAVFLYYTVYCITPLYKASVKIYVNNIRAEQKVEYITGNNLAAAQQLVKTYVTIIRSDTVLEKGRRGIRHGYHCCTDPWRNVCATGG